MQKEELDASGAYAWKPLLEDGVSVDEESSNPAGVGRGDCDQPQVAADDESCALEVTAQVEDLVAEETKPGAGIEGFEGEEVGGG